MFDDCLNSDIFEGDEINIDLLCALTAEEVDELVACLKRHADRHWSIDPNVSATIAKKIQLIGKVLNNLSYIALGKMAEGDAIKLLGHVRDAWDLLGEAGEIYLDAEDDVGWARTRIGRIFISVELDFVEEAIRDGVNARAILRDNRQYERCVYLDMNEAIVLHKLGKTTEALDRYHNALEIALSLNIDGTHLLWPIYYNIALTYVEIGEFHKAEEYYKQSIDIALQQGSHRNATLALTSHANLSQILGKYRDALQLLYKAEELAKDKFPHEMLFVKRVMAECYLHLNRYVAARQLANQAVDGFIEQNMPYEASRTLFHIAGAESSLGNYQSALNAIDRAKSWLIQDAPPSMWLTRQEIRRGRILLKLNDTIGAQTIAQTALANLERDTPDYLSSKLLIAEVQYNSGQLEQAELSARDIAHTARKLDLPDYRYSAYLILGQIAEAHNNAPQAVRFYHAAVAALERLYHHLTFTTRPDFLEGKSTALQGLIRIHLAANDIRSALLSLERAKSLVLLSYQANNTALKWPVLDLQAKKLLHELDELRSEYHLYYNMIYGEGSKEPQENRIPLAELKSRETRMREIVDRLYALNKSSRGSLTNTVTIGEIQRHISDNETLIEYYDDGYHIWAFVVTGRMIHVCKLEFSVRAVADLVSKLQVNIDWALGLALDDVLIKNLANQYQMIAGLLYDALIRPINEYISDVERILIVPYGILHSLPFNVLFDGSQYLIEKYQIVSFPVASLITRSPEPRPIGTRVVGHLWYGNLPSIAKEAQYIHQLLGGHFNFGDNAERIILKEEPCSVLHISAHGEYRVDAPELSYIELADGQLYLDDILQEDLSYELIVLSGCETCRAYIAPGDEVIGLGHGFLYAGAGAVIASLWRADDELTLALMSRLYEILLTGASKATAMRQAQLSVANSRTVIHPAFWGGFQLIGNPIPLSAY